MQAYAFPSMVSSSSSPLAENDEIYSMIMAQLRTSLIQSRSLSPAESACGSKFSNTTQNIVDRMINATNICFENANKTSISNNQSANVTATAIRQYLMKVSNQTLGCANLTDFTELSNCTISTVSIVIFF